MTIGLRFALLNCVSGGSLLATLLTLSFISHSLCLKISSCTLLYESSNFPSHVFDVHNCTPTLVLSRSVFLKFCKEPLFTADYFLKLTSWSIKIRTSFGFLQLFKLRSESELDIQSRSVLSTNLQWLRASFLYSFVASCFISTLKQISLRIMYTTSSYLLRRSKPFYFISVKF